MRAVLFACELNDKSLFIVTVHWIAGKFAVITVGFMIDSSLSIKLFVIVHERLKRCCHFRGRETIECNDGLIDYMTIVDNSLVSTKIA